MEPLAYLLYLAQESLRLYWAALAFNILVFALWVWNGRTVIPLDRGLHLGGGRVLGDSRDYGGLFLAVVIGTVGAAATQSTVPLLSAVGAQAGTVLESFFKRRLGYAEGRNVIVLDEVDIILGATAFLLPATPVRLDVFAFALASTFAGHRLLGGLAHRTADAIA